MNPHAAALVVLAVAGAPAIAAHDPALDAPGCREAMAALQAKESAALSASGSARASLPQIQAMRQRAAVECLGGLGGHGAAVVEPGRVAQPPVSVSLLAVPATAPHSASPRPAITPMPPRVEMPVTVTGCDASGCWASDGSRLNRVGNALLGPRGICRSAGVTVQCP